jgi:alpha-galactosidase
VDNATEETGTVYFGALAYSGNWSLRFESLLTRALRVHGGYEPSDFAMTLGPGESHTTPAFVLGCSHEGRGGASRRLHAFTRDYVLPEPRNGDLRPVLYNSWEAVYFDMSFESQAQLARKAAAIGIELFVIDDGWFGGRRNDSAGLGDWVVSSDVFPSGLNPLIEEVKSLGMRFGLWVEPEMVNPDSDLYRAHPDWVLHFPGRPRTEQRNQLILDFGRPEVVEYIWELLDRLVRDHDITFFKWDMNRYASEPGSPAGKLIWLKHVAGVYSIMDRLRAAHPRLEIQSCSGGGGRVDLGILARTDQVWTSDNTDAYDRVRIQDGFSLAYPPRTMECWVTHEVNHQTGRAASLDLRFDVAMRGALGVGTSLNKLSDEELATYAEKIAFYKRIRPTVQTGRLYRLHTSENESTWFVVSEDGNRGVYSAIVISQLQGYYRAPSRLPGLHDNLKYAVIDEHGAVLGQWSGFQLGTLGLPGDTRFGGLNCAIRSRTLMVEKV